MAKALNATANADFRTSDFLRAMRKCRSFDRPTIQETVLDAAGRLPDERSPESLTESYRELLTSMGYSFRHAGIDDDIEYHERCLLTFDTNYVTDLDETYHTAHAASNAETDIDTVRSILESAGFDRALSLVMITDNARRTLGRELPAHDATNFVKWYYTTKRSSHKPRYPKGCLFYHGAARFPCLLLSPPQGAMHLGEREAILRMRVTHELVHYYLTFTLFADDEHPRSERILEIAGVEYAALLLDLLSECFAHSDTATFFGDDYFANAPTRRGQIPEQGLSHDLPAQLGKWLRQRRRAYLDTVTFMNVFPWICAATIHGDEGRAAELARMLSPAFRSLTASILEPVVCMYAEGSLRGGKLLEMIAAVEASPRVLVNLSCWHAIGTLFATYMKDWEL